MGGGAGCIRFAEETGAAARQREDIVAAAQIAMGAIRSGDLVIVYQPVVSASGNNRAAFHDRRVRVRDNSGKLIAAAEFLPATGHLGLAGLGVGGGRVGVRVPCRFLGWLLSCVVIRVQSCCGRCFMLWPLGRYCRIRTCSEPSPLPHPGCPSSILTGLPRQRTPSIVKECPWRTAVQSNKLYAECSLHEEMPSRRSSCER